MNAPRPHNPTPAVPPVYAPPVPPFQYVPPARPVDNFPNFPPNPPAFPSAFDVQVGGSHYSKMKIQPMEYLIANNIPFAEGSVIKYASRWRDKGGLEDLKKARHILDMLIEMETAKGGR